MDRIKNWYNSQDTKQKINVVTSFSSDCFRVIMASMLSLFVPQKCDDHICSINENISDLIDYNVFVLAFNLLTMVMFAILYTVEITRENWMISHFDYDDKLADLHLPTYKSGYPELFTRLKQFNYRYLMTYKSIRVVYMLNFIFSAILVYHYYYLDYRSITVLLTNILLCWQKITRGVEISQESYNRDLAYSYFNTKNLSFNTIDKKVIKPTMESIMEETTV